MATIGQVVRRLRQARHITQRELEELTRGTVSRGYLANLEKGKIRMPSEQRLEALAHALDVSKRYMLEQAGIIEPLNLADPYLVELGDVFVDLTDEDKEEILAWARWKAARRSGRET